VQYVIKNIVWVSYYLNIEYLSVMRAKTVVGLLAGLFIANLLYAGDTTAHKQFNRVYVGASFTPGISYRLLSHNYYAPDPEAPTGLSEKEIQKYIIDSRNQREKVGFGFDVGAKVGVRLTSFLSIESGIHYARKTYTQKITNLTFGSQWNGNGYDTVDNGYYIRLTDVYHYIDIPLGLNFNFGKKKIRGIVNAGATFNVLIAKTIKSKSNIPQSTSGIRPDRYPFSQFNLSPFLGIGFEYEINSLMSLRIMPTAQIQALKNIDTPITERLWSAGINTCLLFSFKKVSLK
jgi:hypothetical protein